MKAIDLVRGKQRRAPLIAMATFLIAVLNGGCSNNHGDVPQTIHLAIDKWPGYYPAIIARERNMLDGTGVTLNVTIPENTDGMMSDFKAGKYDAICVALGDAIDLVAKETDVKLVLISDESAGGDALLGTKAFDPRLLSRHAKIGTNLGGFGVVFVSRFLEEHGLKPNQVELVNVDAANVPDLLARGELVAGHTWEPYVSKAEANGAVRWFDSSQTPGLIPDGMIVRGDVVRDHPEALRRVIDAWFEAERWWQEHPDDGNRVIAAAPDLDTDAASISLKGIRLLSRADNHSRMTDRNSELSLHRMIKIYSDYFVLHGVILRPVPADQLVDPQFTGSP